MNRTDNCRHAVCSKLERASLGDSGPGFIFKNVERIVFEGDMSEVMDH